MVKASPFAAALLVFLTAQSGAMAQVPVPVSKPVIENAVAADAAVIIAPVPAQKPQFKAKTVKAATRAVPATKAVRAVLSKGDAALYKRVFIAQDQGDFARADTLLGKVSNGLLMGHVLYQRYMHPRAYTSSYAELQAWMAAYSDHPHADKIYSLAQKKGDGALTRPKAISSISRMREPTMRPARRYKKATNVERQIKRLLRKGQPTQALALLQAEDVPKRLDNVEIDILRAEIAAAYLYNADVEKAFTLARSAAKRSTTQAPKAGWVAGLISWQRKDYAYAARYFESAATSPYASGWLVTAASYWAARSHMRAGDVRNVSEWLERGTEYPRTFYGLISTRALGHRFDFNWNMPTFTKANHDALVAIPAGARAVALIKSGQIELAQTELLRVRPQNEAQEMAFLAFAGYAQLPSLSMRLGSALGGADAQYYDAALYPMIPWTPKGGFKVDTALLHAIMKQESRFDPDARSGSGASGLMQLMPATARYVAGSKADFIDDPVVNLEIGQRYLQDLLKLDVVDGNVLYMLIAYNAGPGNLAKWRKRWPDVEDPLLFIELLPSSETRSYIEKVLANYWIYRMRARKDIPTLDAIAAGKTALYKHTQ